MDIDDILAEVDPAPTARLETVDLQELTRAWVNEKNAPELLPWPEDLLERVMERIREQIERVEEQTGDLDPKVNFRLIILQTELERFKFLVRAYLRTRLAKIDQHLSYYLSASANPASQSTFTSAAPAPLLSAAERAYAESHHALLDRTYRAAFLARFPPSLQGLADTAGGIAMAEPPAPDRAVFVRALADGREHVAVAGTDIDFRMRGGEVFAVRWSAVRGAVLRGEAELI